MASPEKINPLDKQKESISKATQLSNEIKKLEDEISHIKNANPNFAENKELYKQIFEKQELKNKLVEERNNILKETQKNIGSEKTENKTLETKDKENIKKEISENKTLSDTEKQAAIQKIDNAKNSADLNEVNFGDGPMSLILQFFAFLTGYSNISYDSEGNEYDTTVIGEKIKIDSHTKLDFIKNAKPVALEIEKKYGIPWQVTIAQSALESGWGKSGLAQKDGNYFGIKAKKGEISAQYKTMEDDGTGKMHEENASFKKFNGMEDSFDGYAKFLTENQRYKMAFAYGAELNPKPNYYPANYEGLDPIKFLIELKKAKYATDSDYVKKTAGIIKGLEDIKV